MRSVDLMLKVSLCRITLPQTLQANSSNKRIIPVPLEYGIPCQAHAHTHEGFQQSQAMPALLHKGSLLLSSACWLSDEKYTQTSLLCYFTESCSHPSGRASSSGEMVLSQGSKLSIIHFSSAAAGMALKIQKEPAGRLCTSAAPDTSKTKTSTHLLACKTSQQTCVHCISKLTLSLHQFLKLTSISSQQTQLKDSDTILP